MAVSGRYPVYYGSGVCREHELRWSPMEDTLDIWRLGRNDLSDVLVARVPMQAVEAVLGRLVRKCAKDEIVIKLAPEIRTKLLEGTLELRGDHRLYYDEEKQTLWFTRLERTDD